MSIGGPEACCAAHAARIAVFGLDQPGRHRVGENVLRPNLGHARVQSIDLRHAAAEHDHIRIEYVDDRSQSAGQAILVPRQYRVGWLFPLLSLIGDLANGPFVFRGRRKVALQAGPGEECLDAAALSAIARRSGALLVIGPG